MDANVNCQEGVNEDPFQDLLKRLVEVREALIESEGTSEIVLVVLKM